MPLPNVQNGELLTANLWNGLVNEFNNLNNTLSVQSSKVNIGSSNWQGKLSVSHNSTIKSPQLDLMEEGNDFARLSFRNTSAPTRAWHIAGYTGSSNPRLNFWYMDGKTGTDILTIGGDKKVHVNPPTTLNFGKTTRQMINLWGEEYGIGVQGWTTYFRTNLHFAWYKGGSHSDDQYNPGPKGTRLMGINGAGDLILSARTNPSSDPKKSLCRALVDYGNRLVINFGNDFNQGVYMMGNEGVLKLIGRDHSYIEFYPKGVDLGASAVQRTSARWAWMGFGNRTQSDFSIKNDRGKVKLLNGSDLRIKKDIELAEELLEKVMNIQLVRFRYLTQPEDSPKNLGVIAQDIQKVFPELVDTTYNETDQEILTVDYQEFAPMALKAIQELKFELDSLKEKIKSTI